MCVLSTLCNVGGDAGERERARVGGMLQQDDEDYIRARDERTFCFNKALRTKPKREEDALMCIKALRGSAIIATCTCSFPTITQVHAYIDTLTSPPSNRCTEEVCLPSSRIHRPFSCAS